MAAPDGAGTRAVIVDDHALVRSGLSTLLGAWGYEVVAEGATGREAVDLVRLHRPDVVFMDINMPEMNGIEAVRVIKVEFSETRVVMLTVSEDERDLVDAIRAGADGYLLKNLDQDALENMIGHLSRGEPVVAPALARRLLDEFRGGRRDHSSDLTERESEVLREVASGATSREIGHRLGISENTVNFHLKNIFGKLHLKSRAQAVAWAAEHGFIQRPPPERGSSAESGRSPGTK